MTTPSSEDTGEERVTATLQDLLRFDTRNPPGNERPAIDYVRARLEAAEIPCDVFEPAPGRANLVARLRGDGSGGGPLLLTSHVDVVAVERDRWRRDPFGGERAEGCIWGRGTLDMKGMTAFELEAFLALRRSRARLTRDVILLVLCDEEQGMELGSKWMVEHEPERIRAELALNEFGGFTVHLGGERLYPIGVAEKGFCWLELTASGEPGHGSLPHGKHAVERLVEALRRVLARPLAYRLHPATRAFVEEAASALGPAGMVVRGLLHERTAPMVLKALGLVEPEKAQVFRAMLHDTLAPTMLRAGEKENVLPSEARAVLDARFLPGSSREEVVREVARRAGPHVTVRVLDEGRPSEVPFDTPVFRTLAETIRRHDPGARPCPWLQTGFTDAAYLSRLGIRCYGFYPLMLPKDLPLAKLVHGHDERVPVDGYRWGYRVFLDAVRALATA